ncbi:MAG: hypothetical protein IPL19_22440 [Sandaracinaceae bacterium]|nr:hypothetical protein [Sandaracinaceae bacterium]
MTDASVTPGRLARYVAFWNEREPATALALLRIAIGCVLAYDLIYLACLDLELTIFGDAAEYNMGYTRSLDVQPLVREVFGPARSPCTWPSTGASPRPSASLSGCSRACRACWSS